MLNNGLKPALVPGALIDRRVKNAKTFPESSLRSLNINGKPFSGAKLSLTSRVFGTDAFPTNSAIYLFMSLQSFAWGFCN